MGDAGRVGLNNIPIVKTVIGTYTVTATDASNTYANVSFPHGLKFRPIVFGSFISPTDGLTRQLPYTWRNQTQSYYGTAAPSAATHIGSASVDIYSIDNTNINVSIKIFDILGLSWLLSSATYNFQFHCAQLNIV